MSEKTLMVTNEKTGGQKGQKVRRYDLIPCRPLELLAEHYGRNAKEHGGKYDARNWERGYAWSLSYAAAMRHLTAFWRGETYDSCALECPEGCQEHSGMPHLVAAAWHMFALLEFQRTHPELDDRPTSCHAEPVVPQPEPQPHDPASCPVCVEKRSGFLPFNEEYELLHNSKLPEGVHYGEKPSDCQVCINLAMR